MSEASMHPPADRRCQIYVQGTPESRDLLRCINTGTHWEKWPGCYCTDTLTHGCDGDFYSWECAGPHLPMFQEAA
jgi:hypothetical protein